MPTAAAPADWSSRPVDDAVSAELLGSARAVAEGMLFTATAAAELDEIGRCQRYRDLGFVGQCRAIALAYAQAAESEKEFVADEVGLAIGATSTTGSTLLDTALAACELPGLLEAVEEGLLTERHVLAVLRELDEVDLTVEQRQAVVVVTLAKYRGEKPGELAKLVGRVILQVDLAAAAARERVATGKRRILFYEKANGQAAMLAHGPKAMIAAVRAALDATLPLHPDDGDDRPRAAREFDLLVDLLTGTAQPCGWQAEIVIPVSVAEGGDLELAEIPGLGPVLPGTARDLLDQATTIAATGVDQDGHVIAVTDLTRPQREERPEPTGFQPEGAPEPVVERTVEFRMERFTSYAPTGDTAAPTRPRIDRDKLIASLRPPQPTDAYRFTRRLQRFLEARDRTCVFPGCNRPAANTDHDHNRPWPLGPTDADNGQCLCRHHHRAKHTVFTVTRMPDGSYRWTTRGGWHFYRQPKGF